MRNNIIKLAQFIDLYNSFVKNAYIRKLPNGKYRVFSEKGKNLGTYDSKEQAKKRLRQIEFFKHKKASKTIIDLSDLDTLSYSAIVRELNKMGDKNILIDFLSTYKNCFDNLVASNIKGAAECALPKTLIIFSHKHNIKLPEQASDKKINKNK